MANLSTASLGDTIGNIYKERLLADSQDAWMAVLDTDYAMYTSDAFMCVTTDLLGGAPDQKGRNTPYIEEPERKFVPCSWCGAQWFPSQFHPGNCGECGGPKYG